ncbi:MAG: DNA-binding response regulator [Candidatus Dadabacteria bacterium]|nr:MAG: DNA-binding response regulator [Candidatus Dadabacteria bacterium]
MKTYPYTTQSAQASSTSPVSARPQPTAYQPVERERPRPNLTEREKEILRLVCDGLTNAEIAASLHVSRETVKSELKRIFRKIGVGNRTQAAVLLVKNHWI